MFTLNLKNKVDNLKNTEVNSLGYCDFELVKLNSYALETKATLTRVLKQQMVDDDYQPCREIFICEIKFEIICCGKLMHSQNEVFRNNIELNSSIFEYDNFSLYDYLLHDCKRFLLNDNCNNKFSDFTIRDIQNMIFELGKVEEEKEVLESKIKEVVKNKNNNKI